MMPATSQVAIAMAHKLAYSAAWLPPSRPSTWLWYSTSTATITRLTMPNGSITFQASDIN